jgi:hypothetical protein
MSRSSEIRLKVIIGPVFLDDGRRTLVIKLECERAVCKSSSRVLICRLGARIIQMDIQTRLVMDLVSE